VANTQHKEQHDQVNKNCSTFGNHASYITCYLNDDRATGWRNASQ
jgi:hypothetical protein